MAGSSASYWRSITRSASTEYSPSAPIPTRTGSSPISKAGAFKAFEERAGQEYRALSPTPGHYEEFLAQISQIWATQPHLTRLELNRIINRITIADDRYDEAIKQSHDRYMAAQIPEAHLVILPGVSHFAMLQNPRLFTRAVLDTFEAPWGD